MEAPDFLYFGPAGDSHFLPDNRFLDQKPSDNNGHLTVDDLLDFSKEDEVMTDAFLDNVAGNSTDSSTVTVVDSCNSSVSSGEFQFSCNVGFPDSQFCGELCVPYDDLAELEWLSNFVEDSFSSDGLQNLQLISAAKVPADTTTTSSSETVNNCHNPPLFPADVSVPGKARSKRTRAAPCDWSSRLLVLSPAASSSEPTTASKTPKATPLKKRDAAEAPGRKCLHCASEKTPQWRTGPMGPKTLCNACGVRYKSGRLVPEYRPAASPTFMSTKHSNSHRKVLELRRQKEVHRQQFLSQSSIFGASSGEEYLIHYQSGSDYRHMI